jgi:photosystem II stability/assembly factor-like uncharacterized protein/sugar lactone lactonase YvrE
VNTGRAKGISLGVIIAVSMMANPFPAIEPPETQVADVIFMDELHGWLSVMRPTPAILRTADGGKTWARMPVPLKRGFYHICFYDVTTGLAIQSPSDEEISIYRTVDGGQTWTKVNTVKKRYLHVTGLKFIGADEALLVGEGSGGSGWVAQLSNRGRTLRVRDDLPVDFTDQSNTLGIFGDGAGHVWIVGKELILHSADNGKTWQNQYQNTVPRVDMGISGAALTGGRAWIAVANWNIYRTEDYGEHWVRALTTAGINFDSISFSNANHGCAVGSSSLIYCTNDGGQTWSRARVFRTYLKGSPFFSKLYLFGSPRGWASVGGVLYKTVDGGRSFAQVLPVAEKTEAEIPGESQALKTSINGPTDLAFDNTGFLYIVESMQERLLRLDVKHASIKVVLPEPEDDGHNDFDYPNAIATGQRGSLFIGDFNGRLRKLDIRSGAISVLVSEAAWKPEQSYPASMAVDGLGSLIIATSHHLLRWNSSSQRPELFAGSTGGFAGDGGLATGAKFAFPEGLAINSVGDLFVADYQNCRIRRIDHRTMLIGTIAGTGKCEYRGDGGPATMASMNYPSSLAVDGRDNIYFVDGNRIRRIDATGTITTYTGTGQAAFGGDGGPADKAMLNNPSGLAVGPDGNLFIAEYVNNRIRKVDAATHIITTVAGNGLPHRVHVLMWQDGGKAVLNSSAVDFV